MTNWIKLNELQTSKRSANDGGLYGAKSSNYQQPVHCGQDVPQHWFTLLKSDGTEGSIKLYAVAEGKPFDELVIVQEDPERSDGSLFVARRMDGDSRARFEQLDDVNVPEELLAVA